MKYIFTLLLITACAVATIAQKNKIDSLDKLISKATTDTDKVRLTIYKLNALSNSGNLDSTISLALATLEEAKRIKYYRGEVDIRQKLISANAFKGNYKAATEQINYLLQFIIPSKDSSDFGDTYGNEGMVYGMQSKYDSSIYFYEKSIGIYERAGKKSALSTNYGNIAIGYQQQSNFPRALFYQQKGLKLAEELKSEKDQAYIYVNIANTYSMMGDTARSEAAFIKGVALAQKIGLKNVELYAYTNLSTLYLNVNKWQPCYDYAIKAVNLSNAMGDQGIEAASLAKAAVSLAYMQQPGKAIEMAEKAIIIADSSHQPLNILQANNSMAEVLIQQEKWKEAIPFFEKGFASIKESDLYNIDNAKQLQELSVCYEKTGDYPKALETYKKYTLITDSARSKSNIQKATELTMNYEFDKKDQAAKAEQHAKDAITHSRQVAMIVGLGLALVLIIVSFTGYRNKQRANALLHKQKKEIENTLKQLKDTQSQLVQSEKMASLGELTAGIAHEIQNPLNFVNNFAEVNKEMIAEMKEELAMGNKQSAIEIANDIEANEEKIIHHGRRADSIVKGMLQHSRKSTGQKELVDINALCDEYLRLSYHGFRAKDKIFSKGIPMTNTASAAISIITDFDEDIGKINIVPQDIGRVLLNLFNNAFYAVNEKAKTLQPLKESEEYKPTVCVKTSRNPPSGGRGAVILTVKDNGIGIPQNILDKIFQPFFTTKPTGEGTGLGLSLSYDIIKADNGEMKVETKEGEGSEFIIELPIV